MTIDTRRTSPPPDIRYSIHDFEPGDRRDSALLYERLESEMLRLVTRRPGARVLDVACGIGKQPMRVAERGCVAIGVEASQDMIGLGRWVYPASGARMVRSIAEELPFRDASFHYVMCQGSLDHFADQRAFMREAARVLRPGGRVIIALANFDSAACRIGRSLDRVARRLRRPRPSWRRYWQIPEDHTVKGNLAYVRSLGSRDLILDDVYGLSLFWLVRGYGATLDRLPENAARRLWGALDRVARGRPGQADMIVSVWRKA